MPAGTTAMGEVLVYDAAADFADQIVDAWRSTTEGIFRIGELLLEAKQKLDHGTFEEMVEAALPFGPRTARRLMAVARDGRLRTHASVLPPSWYTLYELTRLSNDLLEVSPGRRHHQSGMSTRRYQSLDQERETQRA